MSPCGPAGDRCLARSVCKGHGHGGPFSDRLQARFRSKIHELTHGDWSTPIVAYCANSERFSGYNLVLRLMALGLHAGLLVSWRLGSMAGDGSTGCYARAAYLVDRVTMRRKDARGAPPLLSLASICSSALRSWVRSVSAPPAVYDTNYENGNNTRATYRAGAEAMRR